MYGTDMDGTDRDGTDRDDADMLRQELEHYRSEKDRVRRILGQVGGIRSRRRDSLINVVFLTIVLSLFALDITRELDLLAMRWLPRFISFELALLVVSLKIIWMIHLQSRIDHFQFWILNSIEFQINGLVKRLGVLEGREREGR
jgi:hypothetical protein